MSAAHPRGGTEFTLASGLRPTGAEGREEKGLRTPTPVDATRKKEPVVLQEEV